MSDFEQRRIVNERLTEICGSDPFAEVVGRAAIHRDAHGPECGLFPAGPEVMRLVATIVRATGARRILDLGTGYGYSALWLASAAGDDAHVDAVDRFPEHVDTARGFAAQFSLSRRVTFFAGEVSAYVNRPSGPYDLIHDDAWFASMPLHFEPMVRLLRPGGTLTMPNWFLLEDALSGQPRRDWTEFAGSHWAESTLAYARQLSADARLSVTWTFSPPLGLAVKRRDGADDRV